uniref:response regulator transcription factor n=1 Tax=Paractinoplanes polyasparticus TaxID=2856853 RepID=UPI001C8462ED|nr:response regulator [Actinoplanes polyasparticus]
MLIFDALNPPASTGPAPTASPDRRDREPYTVLIAEDDVRELVTFKLEQAGYATVSVNNGTTALALTHSQQPDLVVLDIGMPGMDGLTVCQQLQGLARTAGIPVLILSGRGRDIDVSLGFTVGAGDYIVKPFHPDDLINRVSRLLATRGT